MESKGGGRSRNIYMNILSINESREQRNVIDLLGNFYGQGRIWFSSIAANVAESIVPTPYTRAACASYFLFLWSNELLPQFVDECSCHDLEAL